ncbi:MAG: hypothetical protein R3B84_00745 [Zavarzinella sp.]
MSSNFYLDAINKLKNTNLLESELLNPRKVPLSVQLRMLQHPVMIVIGCVFILFSSVVFIIPQLAAGNRFESPWQFFPFIHLLIGLGMVLVPLAQLRKRVQILKNGVMTPAIIFAIQDQGITNSTSHEPMGVKNVSGQWLDFDTGYVKAREFWEKTIPIARNGQSNPLTVLMPVFGCVLMAFGAFIVLFFAVFVFLIWFNGKQPISEKIIWTGGACAFLLIYLVSVWVGQRWITKVKQFSEGHVSIGQMGIPTIVCCRFIYAVSEEIKESMLYIDFRFRLQTGQSDPSDLAVYDPSNPQQVILLGGFSPPISYSHGKWGVK